MQKIPLWALCFFMAWVAWAAEQPASGKFYVALAACSPDDTFSDQAEQGYSPVAPVTKQPRYQPSVSFCVHTSAHNRYASNLHNLQQEYERERYFQRLQDCCAYNQLDQTWASPQTHDVRTRCTTINFLNGPAWSYQKLKPSPLPPDFYDSFGSLNIVSRWMWGNQSAAKYYEYFFDKLNNRRILEGFPEALPYARAQMRQWGYYEYEGFRAFLKQLPVYEEYIFEIAAQLQHDTEFASLVREASSVAATYIPQEVQRIRELQSQRAEEERQRKKNHLHNLQQQCAQQVFVQQKKQLDQEVIRWETTHPERAAAYRNAVAEKGAQSQQSYCLSAQAQIALQKIAVASSEYAQLTGNALQHEFMNEIITGIEQNVQIAPQVMGSTAQLLHKHSLHSFDDARQANEMGDCKGTAQLIDFGNQLLECCKAFLRGAVDGVKAGAVDAVVGTLEIVQHPIETVQAFAQAAHMLVRLAYDYIPLLPDCDLSLEEYDAYLHQCNAAEQKWNAAYTQLKQKWRDTPTPDLVYQVTSGSTSVATNILVAHHCTKLVASLVRFLRPVVVEVATKLKRKISQLELQKTVPGFLLPPESQATKILKAAGTISVEMLKEFHSDYMKVVEQEIALLRPLFDSKIKGFAEFINKCLKIDYAHILGMELMFDGKGRAILSGFHHDLMNAVENSGLIEFANKIINEYGVYQVDLIVNGKVFPKTFFPAHWCREKVVSAIYEAYEDCLKTSGPKLGVHGKYEIVGNSSDGVKIKIFMTKNGKITTAYPLLKE